MEKIELTADEIKVIKQQLNGEIEDWNANMTGANQKAAGKEVNKLFKSWKVDNKKCRYGKYGETNVSEFWAETVTKAIHGKSDKHKIRKQSQWQSQLQ